MQVENPLDWTAEPFLLLYAGLAGSVLLGLGVWRTRLGPRAADNGTGGLGVLHLAFLVGGPGRAADTALVGLLEAGAAIPDRRRGVVRFDPAVPLAPELMPFRHASGREVGRAGFRTEFTPRWQRIEAELARHGLVPGDAEIARFRMRGAFLLAVPLLLGVAKVIVGQSRHRPTGILELLLLVTAVLGALLLAWRPHRNRNGAAVLAAARRTHARAARAPLPEEIALAFALTGPAVLAGRDYRWFMASSGTSSDGGSGSDSGGDGGSGCGGCSG